MEYIKSIINSIEKVFDVSEENISSLTVMLADIETSHLYNKFSAEEQSNKYLNSDLLSKANLLNALLEIVLENPNMDLIESVFLYFIVVQFVSLLWSCCDKGMDL